MGRKLTAQEQRTAAAEPLEKPRKRPRARLTVLAAMYINDHSVNMALRHKHLKIDQEKLDRARRILRLATEQATIDRALDAVLAEESLLRAHRKARGVGGMIDVFEDKR